MSGSITSLPPPLPVATPSPSSAAATATPPAPTPPPASPSTPSATNLPGTTPNKPPSGGCQNCGGKNSGKEGKKKRGGGLFAGLFGLIGGFFKMLFGGGSKKQN